MAKDSCNCQSPNNGREFVKEIEYLRNIAPVIEAGEQKRETISHACKVIPGAVINLALGVAIGGFGVTLMAAGACVIDDLIDRKRKKRAEKKIKEEEQN